MFFVLLFYHLRCDFDSSTNTSSFCLCNSDDFDTCVERRRCPLVRDTDYYLNTDQSKSKINDALLTDEYDAIFYSYSSTPLKITVKTDKIPNKTVTFVALDQSASLKIEYDDIVNTVGIFYKLIFVDFLSLQIQNADANGKEIGDAVVMAQNVELSNSYIELDLGCSMEFKSLTADAVSLSSADNKGSVKISESLVLTKMTNEDVENIYLIDGASMSLSGLDIFDSIAFNGEEINFHGGSSFNLHITGSKASELRLDKTTSQKSLFEVSGSFTSKVNMIFEKFNDMEFDFDDSFEGTGISLYFEPQSSEIYNRLAFDFMKEGVKFENIDMHKSVSLELLNWESVHSIFQHDFENLRSLILNVEDKMEKLTIAETEFTIQYKDSKGSSTVHKTASSNITLCTADPDYIDVVINSIGENKFTINSTIDNGFFNFDGVDPKIENASNIIFEHGNRNITLKSSGAFVPLFTLSKAIDGVLFEASTSEIQITNITLFEDSFRTGPTLNIDVSDDFATPILQSTFLSENVIFSEGSSISMCFQSPGMVTYNFSYVSIDFLNKTNLNVQTTGIIMKETNLRCDDNVRIQVDHLYSDLISLKNDYNISANKSVFLEDEIITFNVSTSYINLTHDETRYNSIYIKEDTIINLTTTSNNLEIYANEDKVPQNMQISINTTEPTRIYLDSSWYGIEIPENFVIIVESDELTIETNLMKLPSLNIYNSNGTLYDGKIYIKERKPKYTAKTGFILFAVFFCIILILSLVFIIFNIKPKDKKEEEGSKKEEQKGDKKKEDKKDIKKEEKKVHFQQQK